MNILSVTRLKREEEYQEEEERLVKEIEKAITYLSIRDFTNHNLKDVLSEPIELMGDFKEEDKLEKLIKEVNKRKRL